ncbi:MAG: hypothetical protein ACJ74Q_15040 [Pyrinomonadaceae bacterium]
MSTASADNATQNPAAPQAAPAATPKAIVKIEGQDVPLAERIASDDTLLKKALRRYYHSITNSTITRKREGGVLIVTVVKRADFKGRGAQRRRTPSRALPPQERVIEALRLAPEHTNAALHLMRELQDGLSRGAITHADIARRDPEIEKATAAGERDIEATRNALRRIRECRPVATAETPDGF